MWTTYLQLREKVHCSCLITNYSLAFFSAGNFRQLITICRSRSLRPHQVIHTLKQCVLSLLLVELHTMQLFFCCRFPQFTQTKVLINMTAWSWRRKAPAIFILLSRRNWCHCIINISNNTHVDFECIMINISNNIHVDFECIIIKKKPFGYCAIL